jgi:predicted ester cyclase
MSDTSLEAAYRAYITTLNNEAWTELPNYLAPKVIHNGTSLDYAGYRDLIPPHTIFTIEKLVVDESAGDVAARLAIRIGSDRAGLGGDTGSAGGSVREVTEHVFYKFEKRDGKEEDWRIVQVWSMLEGI